jgi:hypothetical protein
MMKMTRAIMASASLILFSASAWSHEVKNMDHTHAFQKKGYGEYRQGHYVNGQQGSIILWSPNTVNSTQGGKTVDFARPSPITKAPGTPNATKSQSKSKIKYGKDQ